MGTPIQNCKWWPHGVCQSVMDGGAGAVMATSYEGTDLSTLRGLQVHIQDGGKVGTLHALQAQMDGRHTQMHGPAQFPVERLG